MSDAGTKLIAAAKQARDMAREDVARLYYEAHITISPVYGIMREVAEGIAEKHDFRLAKLLMVKDRPESEQRSDRDTFMTGHSKSYADIYNRTEKVAQELKAKGFSVWRCKIEDTLFDTRFDADPFSVIDNNAPDRQPR